MPLDFTRRQWLTLIIIGLADFCNAVCVSLQAPFFPKEAEDKGCTATEYGLVFGIFELVVFIISPFYGQYLNRIGPKVLFNGGIFTTGVSSILFGFLDRAPGHTSFITLAFVIRIVQALGNAAFLTASFAIIAKEFPNNVATTFASLETFFGLGLIVGPMVGGALYSVGGYYLPFVVLGSALFVTAILTICILPKHPMDVDFNDSAPSMKKILKIPGVLVCSLGICAASISIGFLGAVMEPHLRQFKLTPILLGMVFVINGGVYALTAPFWGCMVDKCLNPKTASLIGSVLIAAGFCLIGPVPYIPVDNNLTIVIVGLVLQGLGISSVLVSSFTDALRSSIKGGLPDNIETYGLISGLWTSVFALGAFIGPTVSGALYDVIGFRDSTIFVVVLEVIVAIILLIFLIVDRSPGPYKELSSTEHLIKSTDSLFFGTEHLNNKISGRYLSNGMSVSIENDPNNVSSNRLLLGNSFTNKQASWSSRLETNSALSIGYGQYYGSVDGSPIIRAYQETIA